MAAHGIGRPLLSVWHPAVGLSSHSKDCWHSAGTWGETPTTNFCPPLQGPSKLLSCPYSLYSADLYHLPLECSVRLTPACVPTLPLLCHPDPLQAPSAIWAFAWPASLPVISWVISGVLKPDIMRPIFPKHKLFHRTQLPLKNFSHLLEDSDLCI